MDREDVIRCKESVSEALCIMERAADEQAEVRILIALREVMEDLLYLEMRQKGAENVVRLSDIRQLRGRESGAA